MSIVRQSYNHLRNALASENLAASEIVSLQSSEAVEDGRDEKENGGNNQGRGASNNADPLNGAHCEVHSCAHVVGRETADKRVELFRRRANP